MKHTIIRLTLYTAIALVPIGCGSRKVQTSITSNKTVQDTKEHETAQSTETGTSKHTDAKTSTETNTSEGASTTVNEKYDTAGHLIEKRTTVSNKKKSGTRQSSQTRAFEETHYRLKNMERTITTRVTVKEYAKSKTSDTNNKPLYWMLFGIGVIGMLIYGGYKLLTQP